ncbi:hypothetical protein [Prochlorococcus sp. MIT 1307]|uniref:hypothetical protein n=1 Tax=Prochlorococcus sp. MIT 1307 TaxID=3096219 RepID=UPI002A75A503|nr:hypothetical protein [Prochlorococcus sp. MIT 1307]
MADFYCPYCNPNYFFKKQRPDGVLICGLCGDKLVKKKTFKPIRLLGLAACFAFIAPMILMLNSTFNQQKVDSPIEPIS